MQREGHRDRQIKVLAFQEEFDDLVKSDYWAVLPEETKERVLMVLAEYQGGFRQDQ